MATIYKTITRNDKFTDTTKVVKGLFKGGSGSLSTMHSGALAYDSTNGKYFMTVVDANDATSESYFDVAFASFRGTGSNVSSSNASNKETEAIYKQFANILLHPHKLGL